MLYFAGSSTDNFRLPVALYSLPVLRPRFLTSSELRRRCLQTVQVSFQLFHLALEDTILLDELLILAFQDLARSQNSSLPGVKEPFSYFDQLDHYK